MAEPTRIKCAKGEILETLIDKNILNIDLTKNTFRRIIAGKVEKTDEIKTGEGHRLSVIFIYKN